ncbi:MAG: S8/S53 family peptidase [bacterium]|nr:S8/S53 family peptidase [bacterium]
MTVCDGWSLHWPNAETFAWHLRDPYSELRKAGKRLGDPGKGISVAHLDTGYNEAHATFPEGLDIKKSLDFTQGEIPVPGAEDPCHSGLLKMPGHGTGTLGILAGKRVQVKARGFDFDDYLGAAPRADVRSYRISDSVVHFFPSRMARAIDTAVDQKVDVISLSMGGLPSGALREAVNKAYENGTAVFAASGDFFKFPILPISTPRTLVYPARFSRVVAVTGVTAKNKTYARAPSLWTLFRGQWSSWMLRGSYGPPGPMKEGLAAYTPNVAWALMSKKSPSNLVSVDGAGTSSSTPEVAAAAALWLQMYGTELKSKGHWRSWQKVEAVYRALFDSADKATPDPSYSKRFFGQGIMKADRALDVKVPSDLQRRKPARIGFGWLWLILSMTPEESATMSPDPTRDLHREMMQTETAQLVYGSKKLQRILGDHDLEEAIPDLKKRRAFFRALKNDRRCSETLSQTLAASGF